MSNLFGGIVSDTDKSLVVSGGNYGSFGLNTGKFTKLEAGEVGNNGVFAFSFNVKKGDSEYYGSIYEPKRVYRSGKQLMETDEGYAQALEADMRQAMGAIVHVLKAAGLTELQLENAIKQKNPQNFREWVTTVTSIVPGNFMEKEVDFFLQYSWTIKTGQEKSYLELPNNLMSGAFLVPHVAGNWTENTENGLSYTDGNNVHPFTRTKKFMEGNNAKQQTIGGAAEAVSTENAMKSDW